ncbi:hypothetical protein DRQ53_15335, partial [bacterium]
MRPLTLSASLLSIFMLALPASAQLVVSVKATNNAGIALLRSNNKQTVLNLPANSNFTKFTQVRIREQTPTYTSLLSYVYPPYTIGTSTVNRVVIAGAVQLRKKSGHLSLHTTGSAAGTVGTQNYRVSMTTAKPTQVKVDWTFFGAVYDASVFDIKFKQGNTSKSWTVNKPGQKLEQGAIFLNVKGTTSFDVEVKGVCKPGTGSNVSQSYEGFNGSLTLNFLEVGNGSFTTFGTGCSKGQIGTNGVPVRGSTFDIKLLGDVPNKPCALLFGTSKDKHGNIKLPFDLSPIGATGCFLNVNYVFPWGTTTDAAGNAQLRT